MTEANAAAAELYCPSQPAGEADLPDVAAAAQVSAPLKLQPLQVRGLD